MKKLKLLFSAFVLSVSSLLVFVAPSVVHATPNNCLWTGSSNNNFNTAANWSNCGSTVPQAGDNLVFDVTSLNTTPTLTNDMTGLSVGAITFQGTNGSSLGYTLSGNSLTVTNTIANTTSSSFPTIQNNITLGGNVALTSATGTGISLEGAISGTGNITTSGLIVLESANTFTGTVTVSSGSTTSATVSSLGNSANAITINSGATLEFGSCSDTTATIPYNLTLNGTGSSPNATLMDGGLCSGGGASTDETYAQANTSQQSYTFSGNIVLGSDITFGGIAKQTTLTGALTGAHTITVPSTFGGQLIVSGSSNTTSTPNGTYNPQPVVVTLSDSQPTHTVRIGNNATVTIDGTRSDTEVDSGGLLKGNGTVGALVVNTGGTVAPGHSPGCLSSGNLTLSGTYQAEIGGTTPCTGYDQLKVTGTVTVTGSTLSTSLYNGFKPTAGQTYTIISNDGSDAVVGTFNNLAEGTTFNVSGYVFKISYKGGDGNDVVLSVVSVPGTPNTGFALIKNNPLMSAGAMAVSASGLLFLARRTRKPAKAAARR